VIVVCADEVLQTNDAATREYLEHGYADDLAADQPDG
jgi:hypothetical protein